MAAADRDNGSLDLTPSCQLSARIPRQLAGPILQAHSLVHSPWRPWSSVADFIARAVTSSRCPLWARPKRFCL